MSGLARLWEYVNGIGNLLCFYTIESTILCEKVLPDFVALAVLFALRIL